MIFGVMNRLRRGPQAGFSLVEAAIGLVLIGAALLLTMALMAQQPWIERRLAAHHEALRAMETQLEQLRSDLVLPADGELDASVMPRSIPPAAEGLRMWIEVDKQPQRSLYEVRLTARYSVGSQPFELTLESMVFTP
jgi:Tfp pilus assembly protein PilV